MGVTRPVRAVDERALLAVVSLSGTLLLIAAVLVWRQPSASQPWIESPSWVLVMMVGLFALTARFGFVVQLRRETVTFTMSEVPMALVLLYLGVGEAVVAGLVGSLLVMGMLWRPVWYKLVFNASLVTVEVAIAFTVFRLIAGSAGEPDSSMVLGLLAATFTACVLGGALVSVAAACHDADLRGVVPRIVGQLRHGMWMVAVSSIAATMLAGFSAHWPGATALGIIPLGVIWHLHRVNAQAMQQVRDYEALLNLANRVGGSLHRDEIARAAAEEMHALLRAERTAVVMFAPTGASRVVAQIGDPFEGLLESRDDVRWQSFLGAEATIVIPVMLTRLAIPLAVQGSVLVAPVCEGADVLGVMVAAERANARFDDSDVTRASAIASRLSLALRNAQLHEQIEEEAWRDALTGLPNRTSFERAVHEALAGADLGEPTVLVFGIDRFREVNEILGHPVGDQILVELSRRLLTVLPEAVCLSRITGDEFAAIVDGQDSAVSTARQVGSALRRPFRIGDADIVVSVRSGVSSVGRAQETDPSGLLRQADIAMHWAKHHHTDVEVYRSEIDLRTPEQLWMLTDLRSALEHEHLDVYFQPKVDLVTGVVVGAEALVRWQHPTLGFVPPLQFVQLAETSGLITDLTDRVLSESVAAIRLLNDVGFRLEISLNLSTLDLLNEDLVRRVEKHLLGQQVPADQLTLEITETSLLEDGPRAMRTAEALAALGVHLSIDDFGTGFSSLSYLRKLPATELKVDRSFVMNLLSDDRDEVIVRSTIDLGHNLGLKVAAEGAEDVPTQDRLRELGCDLVQGYSISRPMPLTHFIAWLTTSGFEVARAGLRGAWRPATRPLDA